jgi:predicted RND superfamily exporter protein
VSETVAKTRVWGGENEKLEYIEGKGGEKAKMQREERTNMFSLFCAYVIKTAIYMYLCFRRVWSLFLPLFFPLLYIPPPSRFFNHSSPNDKNFSSAVIIKGFIR